VIFTKTNQYKIGQMKTDIYFSKSFLSSHQAVLYKMVFLATKDTSAGVWMVLEGLIRDVLENGYDNYSAVYKQQVRGAPDTV